MYETGITAKRTVNELTDFHGRHGTIVMTALQNQAERMREAESEARQQLEYVGESQARIDAQNASLVTVRGLEQMVRMFADQAQRAEAAIEAYDQLTEYLF